MARHRSHGIEFERQIAQELLAGEILYGLAKRHEVWVKKLETGAFDEDARAADLLQEDAAKITALERMVGRKALGIEFLTGGAAEKAYRRREARTIRHHRPDGVSVTKGYRAMGLPREKC